MTRPAEEPGTPLEPSGNRGPREMVTHDRIRLTGLLQKSPAFAGLFHFRTRAHREPGRSGDRGKAGDGSALSGRARR